jgi:hypothetical protein
MKLRYHLDRKHDGLVLLEAEPQVRSLFIYSQTKNTMRVPLPYILFTVRYTKNGKKVRYPGIYGSGLHVFCRIEPLTSVEDKVCLLPTDHNSRGLVCTDHGSDNKQYNSVQELVNYVVTHWWGHMHQLEYQPFGATAWHEAKLENIKKAKWVEAGTYRKAMYLQKSYGTPTERELPTEMELVDLPWPSELIVAEGTAPAPTSPSYGGYYEDDR